MTLTRVEEFRRNAEFCEEQAEREENRHLKAEYLKLARQWRVMAEHAERYG